MTLFFIETCHCIIIIFGGSEGSYGVPLFLFPRGASADLAQQAEQLTCNHQVTSSIPVVGTICGYRIMAITSAFQADDAGSIPATRSRGTNLIVLQHWRIFYYVGAGCFEKAFCSLAMI